MGRNKIKIAKICNDRNRSITLYKRKKGILKKALELSVLCDVQVYLFIVEPGKITQYCSDKLEKINENITQIIAYTKQDYEDIDTINPPPNISYKSRMREQFNDLRLLTNQHNGVSHDVVIESPLLSAKSNNQQESAMLLSPFESPKSPLPPFMMKLFSNAEDKCSKNSKENNSKDNK